MEFLEICGEWFMVRDVEFSLPMYDILTENGAWTLGRIYKEGNHWRIADSEEEFEDRIDAIVEIFVLHNIRGY
jgi:hypothetical protein